MGTSNAGRGASPRRTSRLAPKRHRLRAPTLAAAFLTLAALLAPAPRADARQVKALAPPPPAPTAPQGNPSPAEQKYADAMVAALNAHDAAKCFNLISRPDLTKRVIENLSGDPQVLELISKHLNETREETAFAELWENKSDSLTFSLLRAETVAGERRLTFRSRSAAFQYFYVVVKPDGDHVLGVDFWSPYYGERASDLLHIEWLLTLQSAYNGAVESQTLLDMLKHFRSKDYANAIATYNAFPDATKKEHWVQRFRMDAASYLDAAAITANGEDVLKFLPDDPQTLFSLEFTYLNDQKWPQLIKTLDAIDAVYHDPQIADLKANICLQSGDSALALQLAKAALAKDPKDRAMLELLLNSTLESEKWDDVPAAIAQWEKGTGESAYEMVRKDDRFKPFRRTPQGKAWIVEKRKSLAK